MIVTSTSIPGQQTQTSIGYGSTVQRAPSQQAAISQGGTQSVLDQQQVLNQQQILTQQRVAQANGQLQSNQQVFQAPIVQQQIPQQTIIPNTNGVVLNGNVANQVPSLGVTGNYVTPPLRGLRGLFQNPGGCGCQNTALSPGVGSQNQGYFQGGGGLQPLIPIRNLPPSTYMGQGLFGQPKAFVDGQPIRNLFRFLIIP